MLECGIQIGSFHDQFANIRLYADQLGPPAIALAPRSPECVDAACFDSAAHLDVLYRVYARHC